MLLLALNEAAALRSSRTEAVLLTRAMQDPSSLAPQSQKNDPCLEYVTSCPAWQTRAQIVHTPTPSIILHVWQWYLFQNKQVRFQSKHALKLLHFWWWYEASANFYVRQCFLPTTSLNFTFRCKSWKCPTSNFYIFELEKNDFYMK